MSLEPAFGRRLIVQLIDHYAQEDSGRVWAAVPLDDDDLSKGFRDIQYTHLANAINYAAWWLEARLGRSETPFEAFAYAGPKDLRYPIFTVAAVKVGRQIVLPSPFATAEAQQHILKLANCTSYLHSSAPAPTVQQTLKSRPDIRNVTVPELSEWFQYHKTPIYLYSKSFEQAKDDPWIVFHTSGTTGLPRPISYTNYMMTALDAAQLMPDAHEETNNSHWSGSRWYTPFPTLHVCGPWTLFALQMTTFLGAVLVVGPAGPPPTPHVVDQVLRFGKASGAEMPPSLIEDMCRDEAMLQTLQNLKYLYYAGAPLSKAAGAKLIGHCNLNPGIGSTEAGAYFTKVRNDEYWDYYTFRPAMGARFEPWTNNLYELVFDRKPNLERWQQVFYLYPDLDVFHTKDLWTKHPDKEGLWAYAGRTDDLIILSHGESLQASTVEADIVDHPQIRAAVVGGEGRPHPFLIVELVDMAGDGMVSPTPTKSKVILDQLWPDLRKANRLCSEHVQLRRELVLCASPAKPLVRTLKNTVLRRETLAIYRGEIDELYQ